MKNTNLTKKIIHLNEIIKESLPVGTKRNWKDGVYEKQSDGSWEKVSEPKKPEIQEKKPKQKELSGKEWVKSLNYDERKIIHFWKGSGFQKIREMQITGKGASYLKKPIKDLENALDRAKKYDGIVYRGLNNLGDIDFERIKNSKSFEWKALSSSSKNENEAARFLISETGKSIMFKIKNKTGVDITDFVGQEEGEIILRQKAKYKIISSNNKKYKVGKSKIDALEIELEEI